MPWERSIGKASASKQDAQKLIYEPIPKSRTDPTYDDLPLKAGKSYLESVPRMRFLEIEEFP
jgi:hypothetical protein